MKILIWRTNFDVNSPSVDSISNKYANSSDHSTRSRIPSGSSQQNKSPITSLQEKAQLETNDERRARKVILKNSCFSLHCQGESVYLDRCL